MRGDVIFGNGTPGTDKRHYYYIAFVTRPVPYYKVIEKFNSKIQLRSHNKKLKLGNQVGYL